MCGPHGFCFCKFSLANSLKLIIIFIFFNFCVLQRFYLAPITIWCYFIGCLCILLSSSALKVISFTFSVNLLFTSLVDLCCFLKIALLFSRHVLVLEFNFSFCYTLLCTLCFVINMTIICKVAVHLGS